MCARVIPSICIASRRRRTLTSPARFAAYRIATVLTTGASEDDQVFLPLAALQSFLGMRGKVTLVELSIPGETRDVESAVHRLAGLLPGLEVRPIRQIVYSEGKVLGTIRWLLLSLTILILVIIALCVMATMTAIVLERRKDIGVMKALGAADALLMRLFMTEGAGLGLVGGVLGYGSGRVAGARLGRAALRRRAQLECVDATRGLRFDRGAGRVRRAGARAHRARDSTHGGFEGRVSRGCSGGFTSPTVVAASLPRHRAA